MLKSSKNIRVRRFVARQGFVLYVLVMGLIFLLISLLVMSVDFLAMDGSLSLSKIFENIGKFQLIGILWSLISWLGYFARYREDCRVFKCHHRVSEGSGMDSQRFKKIAWVFLVLLFIGVAIFEVRLGNAKVFILGILLAHSYQELFQVFRGSK
ncbi:hypothetical protein U0F71_05430 [Burkholderia pseudomallei]|uniref:hypothetical protein n=1 Tax=Burkholderia pseudomallei TaxID=28450 RepID=UPI002AB49B41|nr:hypothetical protein [Burkholderia pseudomallei]MDY7815160.1 hypothetical protein [Burkholderia pseudomallei]MDY7861721.1 hypothetical protein [Burkholderia pseudomallei]